MKSTVRPLRSGPKFYRSTTILILFNATIRRFLGLYSDPIQYLDALFDMSKSAFMDAEREVRLGLVAMFKSQIPGDRQSQIATHAPKQSHDFCS